MSYAKKIQPPAEGKPKPNKLQYPICSHCDMTGYVYAFSRKTGTPTCFRCWCDYGRDCGYKALPWTADREKDFSKAAPWETGWSGPQPSKSSQTWED